MDDPTEIAVAELRAAADRLLDAVERRFGQRVTLEGDEYWSIFPSDAFKLESQPPIGVGQLSDDIATIRNSVRRTDPDEEDLLLWLRPRPSRWDLAGHLEARRRVNVGCASFPE
jgi:hypothetical protein